MKNLIIFIIVYIYIKEFKKAIKNFRHVKKQLNELEDTDAEKRLALEKQLEKSILDLNYIEVNIFYIKILF